MKFKFKTLLASVVLASSAGSANALITTTTSGAGNSELVFSAWNGSQGYTFDLLSALTLTNFIGADSTASETGNNTVLSRATVLSSLIAGPNGQILDVELTGLPFTSAAGVEWNFSGVDASGRNRLMITADNAITPAATTSAQAKFAATGLSAYYPASNSFIPESRAGIDDTFVVTNSTDGAGYAGNLGNNFLNRTFDTTNALGDQSFVYFLAESTIDPDLANNPALFKQMATAEGQNLVARTYQQNGVWRFNLSVAQTAPIPEPETYAMFLAGLGMMGAVARRRKGQVK